MCLAPRSYDLVTHKIYVIKILKKYSMELMELSFEVKENMSEGDYLWVTDYCKDAYEDTSEYLDNKLYREESLSKTKETLESDNDLCLEAIEFIEELSEAFSQSAAGVENQKGSDRIKLLEPDD